jgi:SWI/SNF-related matrix-associated actin-dependent regulator of chromatin subfamily A-like protein 1
VRLPVPLPRGAGAFDRGPDDSIVLAPSRRQPTCRIHPAAYRAVFMPFSFEASMQDGEALLRFPYDDGLRRLLRAIPGRRWDPERRVWRLPLDPECAEALGQLLRRLPGEPEVSEELAISLSRLRRRRHGEECVLDVVRADESWWLSFPTDRAPAVVAALLEHPGSHRLESIGRALTPLDEQAAQIVSSLRRAAGSELQITRDARHALTELGRQSDAEAPSDRLTYEVEMRRDRSGRRWVLIAAEHAALGRTLAGQLGLRARDTVGGSLALAAADPDAIQISELLDGLQTTEIDERITRWLTQASAWRGTLDVTGSAGEAAFLLLGDTSRLPGVLREHAASVPGGAGLPLTIESWRLIEQELSQTRSHGWVSPAARRCIAALSEGRPAPPSVLELSQVHEVPTFVLAPGHDPGQQLAFAALPGALQPSARRGDLREHERLPAIHADPFCVPELDAFLAEHEAWVDSEALAVLQEIREQHANAAGIVALSQASDAEFHLPSLGGQLKPFQRAGVRYLLERRRAFLADEQGLGKTIEALAAIEADDAYPAVIVCPASLKLNWLREIERWLPHRSVQLIAGTSAARLPAAQLTVVNYDIVAARLAALAALRPRALVLDESHYCKNAAAKRTQAMHRLAAEVPTDGLVLALTGTPVMNRPAELISQLRIIGRLGEFGSGAQFSRRFQGSDANLRLHWHLRSRCFVRRLKCEVLPQLPPKTRAIVPVELDNEPEYRLAEHDLIAWLRTQPLDLGELDAKVAAALRAERLVRLNALKLLAAEGKLHAALTWIHDFLASGERLVVFARHRKIQHAVTERFPDALHVLGSDDHAARDAAVSAFQAPDGAGGIPNQLIVCSIELAGHGLTLTRSSNVAFLELDWTPAKLEQAEDRCHRIGQQDAVNAAYLLAADTIDETIATLLERKRAVIGAVTDGREQDEEGVLDAVVRELRGTPYRHLRAVA